jgi:hypothetical protein
MKWHVIIIVHNAVLTLNQVGEYITTLLERVREVGAAASAEGGGPNTLFLQATAASFKEGWRIVDGVMEAAEAGQKDETDETSVQRTRAEDVVFQMYESHMDEYLDEETEAVKYALEKIIKSWDQEVSVVFLLRSIIILNVHHSWHLQASTLYQELPLQPLPPAHRLHSHLLINSLAFWIPRTQPK